MSVRDGQIGGDHYKKFKIQPWDIIDEYGLNFYEGNVVKYILRPKKDRQEDLEKLQHYVEKLIDIEKKRTLDKVFTEEELNRAMRSIRDHGYRPSIFDSHYSGYPWLGL